MKRTGLTAAIAVAVSLVAPACGRFSGGSPPVFTLTRMRSPAAQAEILLKPRGPVKGLVLYQHGYGETERALLQNRAVFALRDALLTNGFAVAASVSHGDNMGSPVSVQDQVLLLHDARSRLPPVPTVDLIGFSMGGLDALMAASRHALPNLSSVLLLFPMCNQEPFLDTYFLGPDVRRVYPPAPGQTAEDAIAPGNPQRQDPHSFLPYRYWFWQSPDDGIVPPTQAGSMVDVLHAAGAAAQLSLLDGGHGNLTKLDLPAVVRFLSAPALAGSGRVGDPLEGPVLGQPA